MLGSNSGSPLTIGTILSILLSLSSMGSSMMSVLL